MINDENAANHCGRAGNGSFDPSAIYRCKGVARGKLEVLPELLNVADANLDADSQRHSRGFVEVIVSLKPMNESLPNL